MSTTIDGKWAFARYQSIRRRLPRGVFTGSAIPLPDLELIMSRVDVFVFDSFGVLNVGEDVIPGAIERIRALRKIGKKVVVLTNAAATPLSKVEDKYAKLGFDFTADEIVSSRHILTDALCETDPKMLWDVIAPPFAAVDTLPCKARHFDATASDDADGIIFLSSIGWQAADQACLLERLTVRPRPLWIGNPDLVAPWGESFSREPGSYAHDIWEETGIQPVFFGKPYANAFETVRNKFLGVPAERFLMLGDTLHTDILGAAAAGMKTGLVSGFGVLRDMDVDDCIQRSGIVPDYVVPGI